MINRRIKSVLARLFPPLQTRSPSNAVLLNYLAPRGPQQPELLEAILQRWKHYAAQKIDETVSPHDDMLYSAALMAPYLQIGISALEVIAEAMLLAKRTHFARVLDLPCGGGRVTRHLVKFFYDAEIFVSDIEKPKQDFVVSQFGARGIDIPQDFSVASPRHYDLIFVGSLVTHFNAAMFIRTMNYCVDALSPEGLLVLSTHGRFVAAKARPQGQDGISAAIRNAIDAGFLQDGFGYVEMEHDRKRYGTSYGASFSTPSWVMQQMQQRGGSQNRLANLIFLGEQNRIRWNTSPPLAKTSSSTISGF